MPASLTSFPNFSISIFTLKDIGMSAQIDNGISVEFPAVTLQTGQSNKQCNVKSVTQALECLTNEWPVERSALHELARQCCVDALGATGSSANARAAFIEAAKEAGIFVDYSARVA